ncbi:Type II secretion system protein N [Vibrio aerogenes CECT 7868]|uniref:Type II secretion system protein N n=1 Tax=Vibrio aerogenes CECT 7868 TaxID=1216006 RepID=A0A1M5YUJ4_9VIBR|nr:type II secretion system protein N [Vibrio aerogenes]SHI15747.1 Type II secretion system protein N [Vibrio aerogenes CECT 7868]
MSRKKVIASVMGVFLIFCMSLVVHLPAAFVLKFVQLPRGVELASPQGTIWHGHLQQIRWQRQSLGTFDWQIHPLDLFTGRLFASVKFGRQSDLHIQGRGGVGASFQGRPFLEDFHFSVPAQTIADHAPLPVPATAEGLVNVSIKAYVFREPFCEKANVDFIWENAQVSLMAQSLPLEKVSAGMTCESNKITVKGKQRSQVLMSEYSVTMDANRKYQLNGWLQPAPGFPESLEKMLKMGLRADGQGRYNFRFDGHL